MAASADTDRLDFYHAHRKYDIQVNRYRAGSELFLYIGAERRFLHGAFLEYSALRVLFPTAVAAVIRTVYHSDNPAVSSGGAEKIFKFIGGSI